MSLMDDPQSWLTRVSRYIAGKADQMLKVFIAGGNGPLSGIDWTHHTKTTAGSVETFRFYDNKTDLTLLATGVLTYENASLNNLVESEWSYP